MASEGLPERLERVVGPEGLEGVRPFDARNPLHVDAMAGKLLSLTLGANDVGSFSLLIDVCEEKLVEAAEVVAQDVGLAMPPDELVIGFFSWLFIQKHPVGADTQHFLAWASAWMTAQAEAWIRDLALLETPKGRRRTLSPEPCVDGSFVRPANETPEDLYAHLMRICFHRLDVECRRLLRARDVQDRSMKELAEQFGMSPKEARTKLDEARKRLAESIAGVIRGMDP